MCLVYLQRVTLIVFKKYISQTIPNNFMKTAI